MEESQNPTIPKGKTPMYGAAFKNIDDTLWKDAGYNSEINYIQLKIKCETDVLVKNLLVV
jgi:hypothetical protein